MKAISAQVRHNCLKREQVVGLVDIALDEGRLVGEDGQLEDGEEVGEVAEIDRELGMIVRSEGEESAARGGGESLRKVMCDEAAGRIGECGEAVRAGEGSVGVV